MIQLDISKARKFVSDDEYIHARTLAQSGLEQLKEGTGPGSEWLGWRELLAEPNDKLLAEIQDLATSVRSSADVFIVCGIGGSYLGAKAVIDALRSEFDQSGPEIIYAGHHMGGAYLNHLVGYLNEPKADGSAKSVYLNVISKSGSTLETALSFRVLRNFIEERFEDTSNRIICTTSEQGGVLNAVIEKEGYRKFIIPSDVGGRFSVLTPVGLLPIAVAGIDIAVLFQGAKECYDSLEENSE